MTSTLVCLALAAVLLPAALWVFAVLPARRDVERLDAGLDGIEARLSEARGETASVHAFWEKQARSWQEHLDAVADERAALLAQHAEATQRAHDWHAEAERLGEALAQSRDGWAQMERFKADLAREATELTHTAQHWRTRAEAAELLLADRAVDLETWTARALEAEARLPGRGARGRFVGRAA